MSRVFSACFGVVLLIAVGGCAPRFAVYEASSPRVEAAAVDQLIYADSTVSIAYEFWSPGGAPWVTMRNETNNSLLLDLNESEIVLGRERVRFATSGMLAPDGLDFRDRFSQAELRRDGATTYAVLPKGEWVGFELPPMALGRCPGRKSMHCAAIRYAFSQGVSQRFSVNHTFEAIGTTRLKKKELDGYASREASDAEYFVDKRPSSEQLGIQIAMEVASALLALALAF